MAQSKVYVVCEPTHLVNGVERPSMNLTPAREFGEVEILMKSSQSMLAPVPTVRALRDKLRNFSDDDYILPVGDPVLMSTVAMVASEMNHGRVKYLKWDRIQRAYFVIQVDTSGKEI